MMDERLFENKVSMIFFSFGIIISILTPFIAGPEAPEEVKILVLLVAGGFTAIFNITKKEQKDFLIAGSLFILMVASIKVLIAQPFLDQFISILVNIAIFILPSALLSALIITLDYIHVRNDAKMSEKKIRLLNSWNIIVLFALILIIAQIIFEFIFVSDRFDTIIYVIDMSTTAIFLIDLFVLYFTSKSHQSFIRECWPDIIAAIPLVSFLKLMKVFRSVKIILKFSKAHKLTRIIKAKKSLKLFSEKSGYNKLLKEGDEEKKQ